MTSRASYAVTVLESSDASRPRDTPLIELATFACALGLGFAAGLHTAVGLEHAGTNFGALSLGAGVAQGALAVIVLLRASAFALRAIALLGLVLIQCYASNVTIGLPPSIAHAHIAGTHQVWLFTLAWPGVVEWQGIAAVTMQTVSVASALWLRREAGRALARP